MVAADWWALIEHYAKEGNYTGVVVCADGLSDCGEDDWADILRDAVKENRLPKWTDRGYPSGIYQSQGDYLDVYFPTLKAYLFLYWDYTQDPEWIKSTSPLT